MADKQVLAGRRACGPLPRAAEAGAWLDLVTPWGVVDLLNRVFGPADVVMFQLATLEAARRRAKRAGV